MTVKKLIGQIHLWLGLASGLIVVILGITGCIYVFIDEIRPLVYQDRMFVESEQSARMPLGELASVAQDAVEPTQSIRGVTIYNDPERTVQFNGYKALDEPQGIWFWDEIDYNFNLYLDPYTGTVSKLENRTFEFFNLVLWLHWSLFLRNDIGQPIVGIAVIIFVISLITGLVLWWPRNKAAAKQRVWFRWKSTTRWKRKNYDLHNIAGFYTMILALLIALTGLVWAFDWFEDGVKWLANGGKTIEKKAAVTSDTTQITAQYPLDKVYQNVRKDYPEAKSYYLSFPQEAAATYYVYIRGAGVTERVTAQYDQFTGERLELSTFSDKTNGEKIRSLNYDIHVGSILGLPGKILAFLASLVSASLPITGFYIWWGRRKKKAKKRPVKTANRPAAKRAPRAKPAHVRPKVKGLSPTRSGVPSSAD
ncbi:MAG: PepSY-associated TM helix domain-containing protein [Bacteroidota bacterium]